VPAGDTVARGTTLGRGEAAFLGVAFLGAAFAGAAFAGAAFAGAAVPAGALGRAIKGLAAGDGMEESCDWGPPVPAPELPVTSLAGVVLVLVSVGVGDTVGEAELGGGSVLGGEVVGEAGGVGGCEDALGVADGEALDGDGDVVGLAAAGDDVDDGPGEGHADAAGDGPS
jgi:hypothetical protein